MMKRQKRPWQRVRNIGALAALSLASGSALSQTQMMALSPADQRIIDRTQCMVDTMALAKREERQLTQYCDDKSGLFKFSADANGALNEGFSGSDPKIVILPALKQNGAFRPLVRNSTSYHT